MQRQSIFACLKHWLSERVYTLKQIVHMLLVSEAELKRMGDKYDL